MFTVGRLAKRFQLSRSTLLYYDSIGLLSPSGRGSGNYRLYTDSDARRLEQICLYRQAGVPLKDIARVLETPGSNLAAVLEKRLEELSEEILRLRGQQALIVGILKNDALLERVSVMNRETWVGLLSAAGFTPEAMHQWHIDFERMAPEKHQKFLEFLCIAPEEIVQIREWSRPAARDSGEGVGRGPEMHGNELLGE